MNSKKRPAITPESTVEASEDREVQSDVSVNLEKGRSSKSPHMPHEHDEASGMTGGVHSTRVQQGKHDVDRGLSDTSRGDEADTAYQKQK